MTNFALIGAAGYVAPRHLAAIQAVGGRLLAATDPHDAVGILDRFSFDTRFFPEIERFERHLDKLRRGAEENRPRYVSICSPNYLHDAHIRLALRVNADAICEKPLVISPWNLEPLEDLEVETGRHVYTVLQLRLHPKLQELKGRLAQQQDGRRHDVCLTYVTARGPWYAVSWKGNAERSGGLLSNIGLHLFDLVVWLFGAASSWTVHCNEPGRVAGALMLQHADVRWFLSTRPEDLPVPPERGGRTGHREMTFDGERIDFANGFGDLHTRVYEEILAGRGLGIADARPSIELAHTLRHTPVTDGGERHPYLLRCNP